MGLPRVLMTATVFLIGATACAEVVGNRMQGGSSEKGPADTSQADRPACTSPSEDLSFRNQWVGPSFDGLPLTTVIRQCALPTGDFPTRQNLVSYLYGSCNAGKGSEGGCAVPLEVQSWPAEERYKELYEMAPEEHQIERQDTTVNGSPASLFEGGHRLEIFYEDVTVVIFGQGRDHIDRVANALENGPSRLTELEQYGLVFHEKCVDDRHYCEAEPR